MVTKNLINKFFDINKLPSEEGILVFPISMSRISNDSQNSKTYMNYINHFNPDKIIKSNPNSKVAAIFIYTDFLYLYSKEPSYKLKDKFMELAQNHKNSFQKILTKDKHIVQDSFSYLVWSQLYLEFGKFIGYFNKLKEIYKKDKLFQKYVKEDFKNLNNPKLKLDKNQINFFLEEHLMVYLISKGQIKLKNEFIRGHEKWVLIAYPGKPLKQHIYLHQKNFFKFDNPKNIYQNSWYDLKEKKLYDFSRVDLDTYH